MSLQSGPWEIDTPDVKHTMYNSALYKTTVNCVYL